MTGWLSVALGGALGAVCRFGLSSAFAAQAGTFPVATFIANALGGLTIGLLWGAFGEQPWFALWGRTLLVVGFLGAFTTFSTFSFETLLLLQHGRPLLAGGYAALSVIVCLSACWLGFLGGNRLL